MRYITHPMCVKKNMVIDSIVVKNIERRWQQETAVGGTYASLGIGVYNFAE